MSLRIRIIIVMLSILTASLLAIGWVSLIFFRSQNAQYHQERLARKEKAIKAEMMYFSKEVEVQENSDIVVKEFEEEVLRLATIHGLDITVFNTKGDLLVSAGSDSLLTSSTKRVPPAALEQLSMVDRVVLPESRDRTDILSDFTVLRNANGDRIAILNLPYKPEASISPNDLQSFMSSIGLAYFFLFLASIAATVILSNSITRNLRLLSESMHNADLSKANAPLSWKRKDEIGLLVDTYNEMLEKFAESRLLLAKKEREDAWREMARQVAHEIKNPLTPIKLSVQHLLATSDFGSSAWQQKFHKTMAMIIQQTESLNRIASDFSDFAQMPKLSAERVNIAAAIDDTLLLFSEDRPVVSKNLTAINIHTFIDTDAFRRVMGNLIRNAIQAVSEVSNPAVSVSLFQENQTAHIVVEDNGIGVPADQHTKIFQPNFTTKSSGTGLGLAICLQIIEQANGKIWFESEPTKPTRFHVTLPIAATE